MATSTTSPRRTCSNALITSVGVLGGGQMGTGIAEVVAAAGCEVAVVEVTEERAGLARARLGDSVARAVSRGKLSPEAASGLLQRVGFHADLSAVASAQLVIEAASEDESVKVDLFARLGSIVRDPAAILASNTSSIPIVKLGAASGRPAQVVGLHFFNPAPVMRLVELVPSLTTSEVTHRRMRSFVVDTLGKEAIDAGDRAGFVVNSLLVPYLLSAIRMLEAGYASADDIDRGMRLGCSHPMGPLALCDLIGLDTVRAIGASLYAEFKEPLYAPPPLLERMVDAGLLGAKSGRGFHRHDRVEA